MNFRLQQHYFLNFYISIFYFVTTNKYKFTEAKKILADFNVEIEQLNQEYDENHDSSIETIASNSAKQMAEELNLPVIVEDTGLFFNAYPDFPGALPKFAFNSLGYKGLLKLLEGENRQAYFKTVIGLCQPNRKPKLFTGTMEGQITDRVFNEKADFMPYDKIFIPAGEKKTISQMSLAKKNSLSQRGKAFRQLGEYLADKKNQ